MEDNRYVTTSLSYCNTCLRLSDIDILTSNDWISDSILSFYLEYIKNEVLESIGERFLFVSPEVT